MQSIAARIIEQVQGVIVGKDDVIRKVLMAMLAGGHILLEDVPGVGKTTLALAFSKATRLDYRRIQFTPDTMASDIVGYTLYVAKTGAFEYEPGAAMCNLLLADEINRTSAKTQSALLEVMEEFGMTVDGVTHKTPQPFVCIATQNPLGSAGTQKLPDSQLDRFMVRLSMGYPTVEQQVEIVRQRQGVDPLQAVQPVCDADAVRAMRRLVADVCMHDAVIHYAARLVEATRSHPAIEQGGSPRAVMAIAQMARAGAFLEGRDYVTPEDVRDVFLEVCVHRVSLTAKATLQKQTEMQILTELLEQTKPPVLQAQ